jgi:heme/copper-type cytochrome/quinol oxidase subunit 2
MMNPYAAILWLCAVAALGVFATMIYSIVAFRGPRETPAGLRRSKLSEVMWALIPIAIVCFAALPAVQTIHAPDQPVAIVAQSP